LGVHTGNLSAQGVDEIFDRINAVYKQVGAVEYISVIEVYDHMGMTLQRDSTFLKLLPPYYYMRSADMRIVYNEAYYVMVDDHQRRIMFLEGDQLAVRDQAAEFTKGMAFFKNALDTLYPVAAGTGEALAYRFELNDALYSAAELYLDEQWRIKRIKAYYRDNEQLCCYEQQYVLWNESPDNDLEKRMHSIIINTDKGLTAGKSCEGYVIMNSPISE